MPTKLSESEDAIPKFKTNLTLEVQKFRCMCLNVCAKWLQIFHYDSYFNRKITSFYTYVYILFK